MLIEVKAESGDVFLVHGKCCHKCVFLCVNDLNFVSFANYSFLPMAHKKYLTHASVDPFYSCNISTPLL